MASSPWINTNIDGIRARYPSDWTAETHPSEEGTSIYLAGDKVTFAVIGVYPPSEIPEEIVGQILDSLKDEHPGLEVHERELDEERFSEAFSEEGLFMTLDTVGYCWVQSWVCGGRSVVVYVQSIQPEAADAEELFMSLCDYIAEAN